MEMYVLCLSRQMEATNDIWGGSNRALNFLSHFTLLFFIAHARFFVSFSLIQIALHSFAILFYDPTNTTPEWMKNVFIYWKEVGTKIYYVAYFNILWRNILSHSLTTMTHHSNASLSLMSHIISKCDKCTLFMLKLGDN